MKRDKYNLVFSPRCPYNVVYNGYTIAKFLCKRDAENFIKYKEYFDLEVEDEKKKC